MAIVDGDEVVSNELLFSLNRRERRFWSLTVGVNEYAAPALTGLSFAESDAIAFHELCKVEARVRGGAAELLLGARADLNTVRLRLRTLAQRATPEDVIVFYFSGHGDGAGGVGYLLLTNTEYGNYAESALALSEIRTILSDTKSLSRVVLLDSCRSGMLKGVRGTSTMPTPAFEGTGIALFLSCGPEQYAYEDEIAGHGFFTSFVLRGLRGSADSNRDGRVSLSELASYLLDSENLDAAVQRRWPGATQRPLISLSANAGVPFSTQAAIDLGGLLLELRVPDGLAAGGVDDSLATEVAASGLEARLEHVILSTRTSAIEKLGALIPIYLRARAFTETDGAVLARRPTLPAELDGFQGSCASGICDVLRGAARQGNVRLVEVSLEWLLGVQGGPELLIAEPVAIESLLDWPVPTVDYLRGAVQEGVANRMRTLLTFRAVAASADDALSERLAEVQRDKSLPEGVRSACTLLACESWARQKDQANFNRVVEHCSPEALATRLRNDGPDTWAFVAGELSSAPDVAAVFAKEILTAEYDASPARKRSYEDAGELALVLTLLRAIPDAGERWRAAKVVYGAVSTALRQQQEGRQLFELLCQDYLVVDDGFSLGLSSEMGVLLGERSELARLRDLLERQGERAGRRSALLIGAARGLRDDTNARVALMEEAARLLPRLKPLYGSSAVRVLARAWVDVGRPDQARALLADESLSNQAGQDDLHALEWVLLGASDLQDRNVLSNVCRTVFLTPPPILGRPVRGYSDPMRVAHDVIQAHASQFGVGASLAILRQCQEPLLVMAACHALCAEGGGSAATFDRAALGDSLLELIGSIPDTSLRDVAIGPVLEWAARHQLWATSQGLIRLVSSPRLRQEGGAVLIARVRENG